MKGPSHAPRNAEEIRIRHRRKGCYAAANIVYRVLALYLFAFAAQAKQATTPSATFHGTVFVQDSTGNRTPVAGRVTLEGPATLHVKTDRNGEYRIAAVPFGTYTVEAVSPGLEARETIRIESSEARLPLELKPVAIATSVVVTADRAESKDPAPSETVSEKTLRDASNVNERFESSLPLIPGVVRGPEGHINLKGTRNTQSGALVNSANVTDPVTGSPAINLPVDVVASVQVISNLPRPLDVGGHGDTRGRKVNREEDIFHHLLRLNPSQLLLQRIQFHAAGLAELSQRVFAVHSTRLDLLGGQVLQRISGQYRSHDPLSRFEDPR